ncbi:hypothetical protein O0A22_11725 [Staphylococcus pseudintermedius]|nr:hypothetical protein [Staphylococcus pseudintermedius]
MRIHELLANLLIILLGVLGLFRGVEMITRDDEVLQNASNVYFRISQYVDIQSLGWLLVISSLILILSVFFKSKSAYTLWIIGGVACGSIHLYYGFVATETAKFINTYYQNITISLYQFILAVMGVCLLWKTDKN